MFGFSFGLIVLFLFIFYYLLFLPFKNPHSLVIGSLQGDFAVDGPEASLPTFRSMVAMLPSSLRNGPLMPLMKNLKIKLVDGVSFDIEPVF